MIKGLKIVAYTLTSWALILTVGDHSSVSGVKRALHFSLRHRLDHWIICILQYCILSTVAGSAAEGCQSAIPCEVATLLARGCQALSSAKTEAGDHDQRGIWQADTLACHPQHTTHQGCGPHTFSRGTESPGPEQADSQDWIRFKTPTWLSEGWSASQSQW